MVILMVLWDDKGFPPDPRVEKECRSLLKAGYDVHLLCRKRVWQESHELVNGVKVKRVDINLDGVWNLPMRGGTRVGFLRHYQWQKAISNTVKELRPDVIHCHDLRPLDTVLHVSEEAPYPKVFADLHEIYPEAIKYYLQGVLGEIFCSAGRWEHKERTGIEKADVAVTISTQAQRYYKRKYHKAPCVVRNTVDVAEFDRQAELYKEEPSNVPRIVYAGGYNAKRGINVLVAAMEIVAQETEAHLRLVGPMPRSKLQSLVSAKAFERIEFTGQVAADRIPSLIKSCDVAVHPILVDSPQTNYCCPHKIFEYMAAGKPIVASRCDSFEEYVEGTRAGVLVKPDKPEKLAEALVHLVQHKAEAETFGVNGRKASEGQYNWEVDGSNLVRMYEGM
jgi:glycosyltransferase involved in cell wall biosynthesis